MTEVRAGVGEALCRIARGAIAARLGVEDPRFHTPDGASGLDPGVGRPLGYENADQVLDAPGAAFVTLTQDGALRGCIGSLTAHRPLRLDVADNAVAAAFRDPRFPPLTADELPRTRIEVSVLSSPEAVPYTSRSDLLTQLRPGVDGLILEYGGRRGTFLPQVWEQLPDREDFVAHLVRKAGLPAGWWDDQARVSRYTVTAFEEP